MSDSRSGHPQSSPFRLGVLAEYAGAELHGDPEKKILGVASLQSATPNDLSFLADSRLRIAVDDCQAGAVITSEKYASRFQCDVLISDDPYRGFLIIARHFLRESTNEGIDSRAVVHDAAALGEDVVIGANSVIAADAKLANGVQVGSGCYIGEEVSIGEDTVINHNVVIASGSVIGRNCQIESGVVIGGTGFGYHAVDGVWEHIPQLGRVCIGDDVDIGANTTIDRGALDDTIIESGVKLDNQIMVAHNCHIGEHTIIAGSTGLAGSCRIGKRCVIGGFVALNGHISIADDVQINGASVVARSIDNPGVYSSVLHAQENVKWLKTFARLNNLGKSERRIRDLERRLRTLESFTADHNQTPGEEEKK